MPNDPSDDSLTPDELRNHQARRLRELAEAIVPANPFWTKRFAAAGLKPGDFTSNDVLPRLPLTTKQELFDDQRTNPPYGTNLTGPRSGFSRLHQTSGTTATPLRWLDTPASWNWVVSCWERIFRITDVTARDVIAFPFSFGPFLAFWAAFDAAARSGALSLPAGGLSSTARLQMLRENAATVLCLTPTYALRLADIARYEGIDLPSGTVRALIVAGEPGGSILSIRRHIEQGWGARVFDHWGMTEVGPLAVECQENPGGIHVLETECIAEVLDPISHEPVAEGTQGELVITNLGRSGSPLFRYRTGDLVLADSDPCPCGRTLLRLKGGILGRVDDMFTVRGNNVFPASIDAIMREFREVAEYRVEVQTRRSMHHVRITIEPIHGADVDSLLTRIAGSIRDGLNFQAELTAVPPGALPRFDLKAQRFHRLTE